MNRAVRAQTRQAGDFCWVFPSAKSPSNSPSLSYTSELETAPYPTPEKFIRFLDLFAVNAAWEQLELVEISDTRPALALFAKWLGVGSYKSLMARNEAAVATAAQWASRLPQYRFQVGSPSRLLVAARNPASKTSCDWLIWGSEDVPIEQLLASQIEPPRLPLNHGGKLLFCRRPIRSEWTRLQSQLGRSGLSIIDCQTDSDKWEWVLAQCQRG